MKSSVSSSSSLSSVTKDLIRCSAHRFAGGSAEKVDSVLRGRAGVSRVSSSHAREHGLVSFSTMSKSDPSLDSRTASRVAHSSRSKRANSSARFAQFWHKFSKSDSALSHGARSRMRDVGLRDAVTCIVARIARYVCMAYTNIGALYSEDSLRVGEVDRIGYFRTIKLILQQDERVDVGRAIARAVNVMCRLIRLDVDVMDGGFNLDDFLLHAIDFVADGLNDFFTVKRQRTVHSLRIRRY